LHFPFHKKSPADSGRCLRFFSAGTAGYTI
jgi:hypothetical protein